MKYEILRTVGAYQAGQTYEWDRPPVVALSAIRAGYIRKAPATGGVVNAPIVFGEHDVQEAFLSAGIVTNTPDPRPKRGRPRKSVQSVPNAISLITGASDGEAGV